MRCFNIYDRAYHVYKYNANYLSIYLPDIYFCIFLKLNNLKNKTSLMSYHRNRISVLKTKIFCIGFLHSSEK